MGRLVRPGLNPAAFAGPERPLAVLGGLAFEAGSLTLIAGLPGAGKTSWLLLMACQALEAGLKAAYLSYEPSPAELFQRLGPMAGVRLGGAHAGPAAPPGAWLTLPVLYAADETDTLWLCERELLRVMGPGEPAFLAVDYLQRIPAYDPAGSGPLPPETRPGQAAAELKRLAVRNGWAVAAAAALRAGAASPPDPFDLLGSERAAYEADRIAVLEPGPPAACGCREVRVWVVKDRRGPVRTETRFFYGAGFFLGEERPPCLGG